MCLAALDYPITEGNRGLGLAWVGQCTAPMVGVGHLPRAGCGGRSVRPGRPRLFRKHASRLEVTDASQIGHRAEDLRDETIGLLVSAASMSGIGQAPSWQHPP
jgi:hypothetical protein